jgi:hypothetical protein
MIDLDGFDDRAFDFHTLAPRQLMNALETSHKVTVSFLYDRIYLAREATQRPQIAVIHVRV